MSFCRCSWLIAIHAYWLAIDLHRFFSAHASAPLLSLTQKYWKALAWYALEYLTRSIMDKRCPRYSRWPWDLQTISFSYGSRYVAHATLRRCIALRTGAMGSLDAPHDRGGFLMNIAAVLLAYAVAAAPLLLRHATTQSQIRPTASRAPCGILLLCLSWR